MNKELYNSTLDIYETDVNSAESLDTLYQWKFIISKDIVNINEKYDQNNNPLLVRDGVDEKDAALAAHRALYALKRQRLMKELIEQRIQILRNDFVSQLNNIPADTTL